MEYIKDQKVFLVYAREKERKRERGREREREGEKFYNLQAREALGKGVRSQESGVGRKEGGGYYSNQSGLVLFGSWIQTCWLGLISDG